MSRSDTPTPTLRPLPMLEDDLDNMVERMVWEREGNTRRGGTSGIRKPELFL